MALVKNLKINWLKLSKLRSPNPDKAELYLQKTRELLKKGNLKRGLRKINKAVKNDSENIKYLSVKYLILTRLEKYKKLVDLLEILIQLDFDIVSNYYSKSKILIRELKRYKKAIEAINEGLQVDPYDRRLIELKFEVLIKMKKFGEALDFINEIQAQTSNNYDNHHHMYI